MANKGDKYRFPLENHRSLMNGDSNYVLKSEIISVPSAAPYIVKLKEIPTNANIDEGYSSPSISGLSLTEAYPPTAGQFYVNYYKARIEFNSAQAGQTFLVKYHGKGSPVGADEINWLYYNKSDKTHTHSLSGISGINSENAQDLDILVYEHTEFKNYPSYLNFLQCTCNSASNIFITTAITKIPFYKFLSRGNFFSVDPSHPENIIINKDCIIKISYNFYFKTSAYRRNIEAGVLQNNIIITETLSSIGIRNLTTMHPFKYSICLPEFTIECHQNDIINLFGRNLTSGGSVLLENDSTWIKLEVF